jgi:hypothetical protein
MVPLSSTKKADQHSVMPGHRICRPAVGRGQSAKRRPQLRTEPATALTIPTRLRIATYSQERRFASYRGHGHRGSHNGDFDLVGNGGVRDQEIIAALAGSAGHRPRFAKKSFDPEISVISDFTFAMSSTRVEFEDGQ